MIVERDYTEFRIQNMISVASQENRRYKSNTDSDAMMSNKKAYRKTCFSVARTENLSVVIQTIDDIIVKAKEL